MLLCNVGHWIGSVQGGVVVKSSFLCSPIHPTQWLWYKVTLLCGGVFVTTVELGWC